jgi:spermidine synthase
LAYFVALTSGFCAIAIEVLWSRGLSLSVSGSVYVFALILAAYLVGIGLGSLWVGQRHQSRAPRRETLSMAYLIVALGTIGTVFLFPKLLPMTLSMLKHRWVTSYDGYLGVVGGASVLMMLPATIAIGAALPLLIGLATNNPEEAEQMAGRLYGVNTIGGVLGSSLAIYWLMPTLGLTVSLVLFAGLYVLIACVVLASFFRDGSRGFLLMFWGGVVLFFAMMGQADDINPLKYRAGEKLLYYQDTSSGTIAIYQNRRGERVLRNNNYYGLSRTNAKTLTMQYRLGLLPVMLHKRPETTLLIGFATGTTLSAMASYPTVKRAECVELHGIIPKLAPYFAKANHRVWRAKNTRIQVADGRRYVLRSDKRYDVIVGDLYLPKNPGVGALYSVEHFRAVKRRLQKGGVFVSWMPAFQRGPQVLGSVSRAFLMVFPKAEGWVSQWSTNSPVLGLVGTQDDSKVSVRPGFDQRLGQYVGQLLTDARTGRSRRLTLLSPASRPASRPVAQGKTPLRLVPSAALRKWSRDVPPNRLQRALIEFWSPRSMMEAKMKRFPLSYQNIAVLGRLGLLKGTPWEAVWHKLNKHPGAHWFPLKQ